MGETWTGQRERGGQDAAGLGLLPFTEMGAGLGRFSAANTGLQARQFRHRRDLLKDRAEPGPFREASALSNHSPREQGLGLDVTAGNSGPWRPRPPAPAASHAGRVPGRAKSRRGSLAARGSGSTVLAHSGESPLTWAGCWQVPVSQGVTGVSPTERAGGRLGHGEGADEEARLRERKPPARDPGLRVWGLPPLRHCRGTS